MSEISRNNLFGKMNAQLFRAAEAATVTCKLRGNPYVELVHWLHQIIQDQDSDFRHIFRHHDLSLSAIEKDITAELERLPRGATAIVDFSEHIDLAIERAWIYASLLYGDNVIRGGYLLVGILKTANLRPVLLRMSQEFRKLQPDLVADGLAAVIKASPEEKLGASDGSALTAGAQPGEASMARAAESGVKGSALKKFAVDLTDRARQGLLDRVTGRDDEIRQIIDILLRRRQNNPLLTGEAGVGKTAVVEGFAARVVSNDVPPALRDITVYTLDVGLLQAGASMKGEFEQRLRQVIDEVQASPGKIVLFVDEIHTLIGAGGAAGTGDAANLLKPALARGNLRTIGATTWAEYKKYIEKDPALTRRFQAIQIDEPTEDKAIAMLRGVTDQMEAHHKVLVLDQAIDAAVRLSHRYIPARQLPDKAVSLLDTACARVSLTQHATPVSVEAIQREISLLEIERSILLREESIGMGHAERVQQIDERLQSLEAALVRSRERWEQEHALVQRMFDLRRQLNPRAALGSLSALPVDAAQQGDGPAAAGTVSAPPLPQQAVLADGGATEVPLSDEQRQQLMAELEQVQAQLGQLQGEQPLVLPAVDEQAVATVVSEWTGIPVGRMVKNEIAAVLSLADTLGRRVVGQGHSLDIIAQRIQISRARVEDASKPIGVFMLVGPSGVGKTETALALAESLYGGEQNLITINMSEFQEAHTVSTLKGAPPGYVGYGEGGVLTEAVRRKPYSVVLLDEVEKAHSDVHEIFFQVFDKGFMEDGEGRHIDFKNTVIILTSNVGTDLIMNMCNDPDLIPDAGALASAMREPLLKVFPAAFLGRLTVVPYFPLAPEMLSRIIDLKLRLIQRRMQENHQIDFSWDQAAIDAVMSRATDIESGGRMIDAILSSHVLSGISRQVLQSTMEGRALASVGLSASGKDLQLEFQ
ncbi:protein disaggregation chaperone [Delftia tsuruhatensis]|uniref:type VI secretion system ATPase TssH n=1 Tax=Delftia tsuruhatensis TaxID=180282 RepID=UPI001E7BC379|nr:type VI secretion system ATPase TssH [Delftia tsuruhatensis]CAB5723835.1 protein disaggregation chaperone [Delftia tsuruhatensis]CAC9685080.1 protein disaggregation chaperone [Delftia tsuruhatensis]